MEVTRKLENFPKNEHFLPPDMHTDVYAQGVRNVHFLENLLCFAFLLSLFWDSTFYLITNIMVFCKFIEFILLFLMKQGLFHENGRLSSAWFIIWV